MFGPSRQEIENMIRDQVRPLEYSLEMYRKHFWDLISLLRSKGDILPPHYLEAMGTATVFISTAEPSVCGCPVAWMGDSIGRVVYHRKGICPLEMPLPETSGVSVGVQDGSA